MMIYRPHDLLRLVPSGFEIPGDAPAWAAGGLVRDEAWVVVRRAVLEPGSVPVGARGSARHERYAFSVPAGSVLELVTPEKLARERRWGRGRAARLRLPTLAVLDRVAELLESRGLAWGPAGSAGFELASGLPAVTEGSDLDLILRCHEPLPKKLAREILRELALLPVRSDAQIDMGSGSFALTEWANHESDRRIMLRRAEGPVLTQNPWREPAGRERTVATSAGELRP